MVKKSKVVKDIDFEEVKNEEELTDNEKVIKFIKELVPYVVILLFVIVLRTYVVTPIKVNGSSMDPTLNGGEIMLLTKYDKDELKRHDIVIVNVDRIDGINEDVIKRIIALPGETISCERGQLFLNGKKYTGTKKLNVETINKIVENNITYYKYEQGKYYVYEHNNCAIVMF